MPLSLAVPKKPGKRLTKVVALWYNSGMDRKTIVIAALTAVVIMNIAAFALMGHDKRCARHGRWRVPERTLFLVTACFGGLGGVLGMYIFHHKTQHWYFRAFFPALLIAQIGLLAAGIYLLAR